MFYYIVVYILGPNDNEFRHFHGKKNFTEAKENCIADGGNLAILGTMELMEFARKKFGSTWVRTWIGATDMETEGVWKWIDGSKIQLPKWENGQPNGDIQENGLVFSRGMFRDLDCQHSLRYLCERRRISNRVCTVVP